MFIYHSLSSLFRIISITNIYILKYDYIIIFFIYFLKKKEYEENGTGTDAIKKFTPSLGIPYLGV